MRHILRAAGELISCRVLQRSCLLASSRLGFFRVVHERAKTRTALRTDVARHARSGVLANALTLGLALRLDANEVKFIVTAD